MSSTSQFTEQVLYPLSPWNMKQGRLGDACGEEGMNIGLGIKRISALTLAGDLGQVT